MGNVTFGAPRFVKPEVKPAPKKTKVKEVELLTPLEDGSANDGTGVSQKGFVFGNGRSYFCITSFCARVYT